jgi:small subunit ribosomal protein S6
MNKYEAMIIIKPDLSEEEKKALFGQINDAITKSEGKVNQANIWSERRKLHFPIRAQHEGVYYLVNFNVAPSAIVQIRHTYTFNENILRALIIRLE